MFSSLLANSRLPENRRHAARPPGRLAVLATAAALVVTAATLASSPAAAQTTGPVPAGESPVWLTSFTIVNFEEGGTGYTGCSDNGTGLGVGTASCDAPWLSGNTFNLAGQTYKITFLATDSTGNLTIKLDKQIPSEQRAKLALDVLPYVEPEDTLITTNNGFVPGYTAPNATRFDFLTATDHVNGTQTITDMDTTVTDWKMATSDEMKYPNGRTCSNACSGTAWGWAALRIVYEGTPPQAAQAPGGSGNRNNPDRPLGALPRPENSGEPLKHQEQGKAPADAGPPPADAGPPPADAGPPPADAGPPPADAGPPPADAGPPPRPPLQGVAADYDADGDGLISSDEYLTGATDYGKTELTVEEILQLRQAYIDSQNSRK